MVLRAVLLLPLVLTTAPLAWSADANDLVRVLQSGRCSRCRLSDADLVHADLRDAELQGAQLQRANLGQARLDGANLKGADLSFTSLNGTSLRGADLRGSNLYGTDLRNSDLSGARLDPGALEQSHWQGAQGIEAGIRSHAALHNAGVDYAQAERWLLAEQLFSEAIRIQPDEPLSWVARGISRSEQTKDDLAASDFRYAASIYESRGSEDWADQLRVGANLVQNRRFETNESKGGRGMGGQFLHGAMAGLRMLAPIAAKALIPIGLPF